MGYDKRYDGRSVDEVIPIEAKAGVIKNADGSAYFRIGGTWAYATVYGPREMFPRFQQNPKEGVLRVKYNMLPFSGQGDRVRPGPNRRAKELSMVSTKALIYVVDLSKYPNAAVDVFIDLPETDAGSRCAGICAASIALADAGIIMKDMVAAVAVGRVDETILVDLSYQEEATEDGRGAVDIATSMIPSTGDFTLLQLDGVITKEELKAALEKAKTACAKIAEVQRATLQDRYTSKGGSKK